jgi:hypothetical protein
VQALLLTEEENRNTLERGGILPPETENSKNHSGKRQSNRQEHTTHTKQIQTQRRKAENNT